MDTLWPVWFSGLGALGVKVCDAEEQENTRHRVNPGRLCEDVLSFCDGAAAPLARSLDAILQLGLQPVDRTIKNTQEHSTLMKFI